MNSERASERASGGGKTSREVFENCIHFSSQTANNQTDSYKLQHIGNESKPLKRIYKALRVFIFIVVNLGAYSLKKGEKWSWGMKENKFNTFSIKSSFKNHFLIKHHDLRALLVLLLCVLLALTVLKQVRIDFFSFPSRLYHFMCSMMIIIIISELDLPALWCHWCIHIFSLWYFILGWNGRFIFIE